MPTLSRLQPAPDRTLTSRNCLSTVTGIMRSESRVEKQRDKFFLKSFTTQHSLKWLLFGASLTYIFSSSPLCSLRPASRLTRLHCHRYILVVLYVFSSISLITFLSWVRFSHAHIPLETKFSHSLHYAQYKNQRPP